MGLLTAYCPQCFETMEYFCSAPVSCKHCGHTITDQKVLNASMKANREIHDLRTSLYVAERNLRKQREV